MSEITSNSARFLRSTIGEPAWNMALDETLLNRVESFAFPVLRFYGWSEPAGTFGYSQAYADVARITALRPLLRRPTGGGFVPHDSDWTYSLAIPPQHPWYRLTAAESYRRMHEWVVASFARLGEVTELAPCCRKEIPGQCFRGAEKYDVLWHGRKIAGAAQRRPRHGLLIQGSVQPPIGLERAKWEGAMVSTGAEILGPLAEWPLPAATATAAEELAQSKYCQTAYNQKR